MALGCLLECTFACASMQDQCNSVVAFYRILLSCLWHTDCVRARLQVGLVPQSANALAQGTRRSLSSPVLAVSKQCGTGSSEWVRLADQRRDGHDGCLL